MKTKLLASTVLAVSLLISQTSFGHGDHAAPPPAITEDAALKTASKEVKALITEGKAIEGQQLNKSWEKLTPKLSKKGEGYYVVALENPAEKKTLYVLLADYGKFWDANFSGKFEGINTKD
jgi:hypothetical protein